MPLKGSEAGGDLVLIETSFINQVLLMLTRCILCHMTKVEKSVSMRSTPASREFKGQVTEQTTVKWSFRRAVKIRETLLGHHEIKASICLLSYH